MGVNHIESLAFISAGENYIRAVIEKLKAQGYTPTMFMVSHESLNKVWARYKELSYSFETKGGALDISSDEINDLVKNVTNVTLLKQEIDAVLSAKKSYR